MVKIYRFTWAITLASILIIYLFSYILSTSASQLSSETIHPYQKSALSGNDETDNEQDVWVIEFARWGNATNPANAQYVVQPYNPPGNLYTFTWSYSSTNSLHQFDWYPDSILYGSYQDHQPLSANQVTSWL